MLPIYLQSAAISAHFRQLKHYFRKVYLRTLGKIWGYPLSLSSWGNTLKSSFFKKAFTTTSIHSSAFICFLFHYSVAGGLVQTAPGGASCRCSCRRIHRRSLHRHLNRWGKDRRPSVGPRGREHNFYHPRMRIGNNFSQLCVSVCVSVMSVCSGYKFWTARARNFIFSVQIHLDNI